MKDRHLSALLFVLICSFGFMGYLVENPPFSDPLGPRFLPLLLIAILFPLIILEFLKPKNPKRMQRVKPTSPFQLLFICFLYMASWPVLGFLLATTLCLYLIARQFQCSWMQALMVALVISVFSYGLFHFLLDISLPLGEIYIFAGG